MQDVIGSSPGKLENKPRGVARNTWSRFPVSGLTPLFVKQIKSIFAGAFPYCMYSSVFARFEDMDSSSKSFADAVRGPRLFGE